MSLFTRDMETFPSTRIPSSSGGLPVDVSLIAQLGHGSGDHLFAGVLARQKAHRNYVDALDEPSAKLAGTDFEKGDPTSLYTFAVGSKGHPFHRHAGHRVFTAVSGSGGTQLRFSSATPADLEHDPISFLRELRYINIPPDCLFTVRFGGDTWHQFSPRNTRAGHPAFFAMSCHTNELGGELPSVLRQQILADEATIPALTELLPENVLRLLQSTPPEHCRIPTISLSLDAPAGSLQSTLCRITRGCAGALRHVWSRCRRAGGFFSHNGGRHTVVEMAELSEKSLLHTQLEDVYHQQDTFVLSMNRSEFIGMSASDLLSALLDGFLKNPPSGVSRMMAIRNRLVKPLGLRTSPLGCPVSSLLVTRNRQLFKGRFPVIAQAVDHDDQHAQVILGADDKHLRFRSCVGVRIVDGCTLELSLGTRVQCKNSFGHAYMAAIDRVHRSYVSPTMLRMAAEYAFDAQCEPQLHDAFA